MPQNPLSFSVFGAGNVGANLADALRKNGFTLKYIYKKTKHAPHLFQPFIQTNIPTITAQSDILFICTQESKIAETVQNIADSAKNQLNDKIVYHTANSLTSTELLPLTHYGAKTASFSPLQTFPDFDDSVNLFADIFFLLEGHPDAVNTAKQMAHALNAHTLPVASKDKIHAHTAAVAASNFLISILKLSQNQLNKMTNPPPINILLPLIQQTLKNIETKGVTPSLTGPLKRKETTIIQKHLSQLDDDEAYLYKALTGFLASGGPSGGPRTHVSPRTALEPGLV